MKNYFENIQLTADQQNALAAIESFLSSKQSVFLLHGYAGTGKTTLLGGLCKYLTALGQSTVLMAPTGRAAMILSAKTGMSASTIHKHIYNFNEIELVNDDDSSFRYAFKHKGNTESTNTVYLVDEASMVSNVFSDDEFFYFGSGFLLNDLMEFVFAENTNRKIVFIGDNAQLPPIGMNYSPALTGTYFTEKFGIETLQAELKQVVRQGEGTGVLQVASEIRKGLVNKTLNTFKIPANLADCKTIQAENFIALYTNSVQTCGADEVMVVTHSNKQALEYNLQIRTAIYGEHKPELQQGDKLIITRNNYNHEVEIFNGTFARVIGVGTIAYKTSCRFNVTGGKKVERELVFRQVVIELPTNKQGKYRLTCMVLDNFIFSGEGKLHPYDQRALFIDFKERMRAKGIKPKSAEFNHAIKADQYFNALQVKLGFAVTCHKAQGGEWNTVFADFNVYFGRSTQGYYRWAYTAVTRANKQLYAINLLEHTALSVFSVYQTKRITPDALQYFIPKDQNFVEYRLNRITESCLNQQIEMQVSKPNYQLQFNFKKENDRGTVNLYYKDKGFSITEFKLFSNEAFKKAIQEMLLETNMPETVPFEPRFEFQTELHNFIYEIVAEAGSQITNIVQLDWSDRYYLKTQADAAYIEFYFNAKNVYSYALPASALGAKDEVLNAVIQKLQINSEYVV